MPTIRELIDQRDRAITAEKAIIAAMDDLENIRNQGVSNAQCAAAWAAVMMAADILKVGMSSWSKVAAAEFKVIDAGIERASMFLSFWGHTPIATKADLLKQVDPEFKGVVDFVDNVNTARTILKKLNINPPPASEKGVNLILDLATSMAEDTALLLQTCSLANSVNSQYNANYQNVLSNLMKIKQQIWKINVQVNYELDKLDRSSRTV